MRLDEHNRDTRDFAKPAFEIFITGSDYEATKLLDSLNDAVICISSLVVTDKPFKARVFCETNR